MSTEPRLGFTLWDELADDADIPNNDNLFTLSAFLNLRVQSATVTVQPAIVAGTDDGKIWILPSGKSGAQWTARAVGDIAMAYGGLWKFYTPKGFIRAHVSDTGLILSWSGTAWVQYETLLGALGTALASASTVTLANATGDYLHITGTTTINSFGTAKTGLERTLVHDAAHTLTHSANIINLTGANVTTAAGDISKWRNEGGTVWRMVAYVRASGLSLGAAADSAVVHLAGAETITGEKEFTARPIINTGGQTTIPPFVSGVYGWHMVGPDGGLSFGLVDAFGSGSGGIIFRRAAGTAASPTATPSGTVLGQFQGRCYGDTLYPAGAACSINFVTGGTATDTSTPGEVQVRTTPAGSLTTLIRWSVKSTGHLIPGTDNAHTVGDATFRVSEYWGAIGAINTSDAREKTAVRPFTQAELDAARELADAVGFFKFLASVEKKGQAAREHCGLTVQRAIEIMQAHDLDPFAYGFICHDEWDERPEVTQHHPAQPEVRHEGSGALISPASEAWDEVIHPYCAAGDRYSFRPDQMDRFILKGVREEQKRLAARIAALEAR